MYVYVYIYTHMYVCIYIYTYVCIYVYLMEYHSPTMVGIPTSASDLEGPFGDLEDLED